MHLSRKQQNSLRDTSKARCYGLILSLSMCDQKAKLRHSDRVGKHTILSPTSTAPLNSQRLPACRYFGIVMEEIVYQLKEWVNPVTSQSHSPFRVNLHFRGKNA